MDLINKFLNIVAPPFTFFSICILLPPTYLYKLFLSTLSSVFSESLSGKVVLITGASSGIGEHLAYEYARRGALLALIARRGRRENALQEVADQAREYGSPDVLIISADVSKVEDLDHLVNNVGIALACLFKDATDITDFKTVMDINFWGSIYTTRFALPHLRESRGKIIVLASSSWLPTPRMSFYNASSVAIVSFFETLRVEAIVNSACKGERYSTEPAWFRVTYFWKVFFPEVIEWCYRLMYINRLGTSHKEIETHSKKDNMNLHIKMIGVLV
ncbi:hypothetical protein ACB092_04G205100 [Castanea dentata]